MNKFLFSILFLLNSSLLFSQEEEKFVNDTFAKADSTINEKWYGISFMDGNHSEKPKPAEHKPVKMVDPETFVLINGLKVILVENNKLPFTSYKIVFDYTDILLADKKGVDLIFDKLWGKNGRKNKASEIEDYKLRTGTNLVIGDKSIYVEGLSRYQDKNISLLSDLSMQFRFTEEEFEETKQRVIDSLYFASNRNELIVDAVARKLMFGSNNPNGEIFEIGNIENLTSKDVREYYNSFFNPNNCYLMAYGDVSMRELRRQVINNFNNFRKGEVIRGYYPQPYNLPQIEIDFVENYNSDSLRVWMGSVINKDANKDNWLLEKSSNAMLFDNRIGLFSDSFLEGSGIINLNKHFDDDDKYFSLEYDVSEIDVASSIKMCLDQMSKIEEDNPIDSVSFVGFKERISQNYIIGITDPHKISDLYLNYYISGFGRHLVPNLMGVIDTISLSSLNAPLKNKIKVNQFRIVVSGKPKTAVPKLEKLGYKLNYYDQFANVTFPPSLDRAVPDSINVNDVISRYINKRGGEDKLKEVRRLLQWWVININDTKLSVKNKYMLPNRRLSTYSNNKVIVLKTVFNGEYGYVEKSGTITEIEGAEFLKLSMEKSIFPIMYFHDLGYVLSLESQIPLKGEECYKVRAEAPYGQVFLLYFRIEDGLLIRKEDIDMYTDELVGYVNYSDFKTYDDIVFPYKTETEIGGKKTEIILTQIKINDENIRKSDFK